MAIYCSDTGGYAREEYYIIVVFSIDEANNILVSVMRADNVPMMFFQFLRVLTGAHIIIL